MDINNEYSSSYKRETLGTEECADENNQEQHITVWRTTSCCCVALISFLKIISKET